MTEKPNQQGLPVGMVLLDRYEIVRVIGEGGWGLVYEGRHQTLGKRVAIKVLHPHLSRMSENAKRFEREAQIAGALQHPNLATVHDFGVLPSGQPFFVMEYYEGKSLAELIEAERKISEERVISIFIALCDGLSVAHAQGCLHRDIKPGNVLIVRHGETETPVLMDFGLAKLVESDNKSNLTRTGETLGTPHYMSPEQCVSKSVDVRSDIYSLGCVMYECLTGEAPFSADSVYECMHKHLQEEPAPFKSRNASKISSAMEQVVFHCLEKAAEDRPQTADELRQELLDVQDSSGKLRSGSRKRKAPSKSISVKRGRARGIAIGAITIVLIAAIGAVVALSWQKTQPLPATTSNAAPAAPFVNPPERFQQLAQLTISQDQVGNLEQAKQTADEMVKLSEQKFGAFTPATSDAYYLRGRVLEHQGRYQEAISDWNKCMNIKEKLFGHDNPAAVMAYLDMAHLYEEAGQKEEAKLWFAKAETLRKRLGIIR